MDALSTHLRTRCLTEVIRERGVNSVHSAGLHKTSHKPSRFRLRCTLALSPPPHDLGDMQGLSPPGCFPHPGGSGKSWSSFWCPRGLVPSHLLGEMLPRVVQWGCGSDTETSLQPSQPWFLVVTLRTSVSPHHRFACWGHCKGEKPRSPALTESASLHPLGPGDPGGAACFFTHSASPAPLARLR